MYHSASQKLASSGSCFVGVQPGRPFCSAGEQGNIAVPQTKQVAEKILGLDFSAMGSTHVSGSLLRPSDTSAVWPCPRLVSLPSVLSPTMVLRVYEEPFARAAVGVLRCANHSGSGDSMWYRTLLLRDMMELTAGQRGWCEACPSV